VTLVDREHPTSSPFFAAEALRTRRAHLAALHELALQDVHEVRLLLRGDSVIDWYRLALASADDVRRLLALNSLDVDDPRDVARLQSLRDQAARYITDVLHLKLDEDIVAAPPLELPLLASDRSRAHGSRQRSACTLLKVMHIIYHLDARELLPALSIPDAELFALVEESALRMFDGLRESGVPVREYAWSRKTRESQITKLLVKRETSAARVFDRLRFRVIVERPDDLIPTLHVMLHKCIPFNYVVPGQTVNTLLPLQPLDERVTAAGIELSHAPGPSADALNEFSAAEYRVLNFVADLPVRIDGIVPEADRGLLARRGRVVFVLAEFQIIDRQTAETNETGESSHDQYKRRQYQRVRERLLREPREG
jgi:uncharacterized protein (TIGR04552 family)